MNVRPLTKATNERSDATRKRLIDAGLDLFGMNGYDATTTRALADMAEANLAAIPYHFGGKDGLYRAVAQAVIEGLAEEMDGFVDDVAREVENGVASPEQAIVLAERLLVDTAEIALMRPSADRWIRFILREQMEPTEVFDLIYDSPIKRMRNLLTKLLSHISGLEPDHPRLRMTGLQLLGLIYIFRMVQTSIMRDMQWQAIEEKEFAQIRATILDNTHILLKGLQTKGRG